MNGLAVSRREMFSRFFRPLERGAAAGAQRPPEPVSSDAKQQVAVIQGRYCLAYQKSFCTTCYERCPVSGAIEIRQAMPSVVTDLCTGCGICHEVCPAPRNAVLMLPSKGNRLVRQGKTITS